MDELYIQNKLVRSYEQLSQEKFYLEYQRYWSSAILEFAPKDRDCLSLDCGCGIGRMLGILSFYYNNVYGMDISLNMLRTAYRNGENIRVSVSDVENIAFRDESFDMVICKGSLHHFKNLEKAVREIHRVLKRRGLFIISEPCRDNRAWRGIGLMYVKLSRRFSHHHNLFHTKQLKEIIIQSGFKIEKAQRFGFIGFMLCGLAHQFPIMKFLPLSHFLSRILIKVDKNFTKIPLLRKLNWHIIIHSRKA